jgi:hypothetical protein
VSHGSQERVNRGGVRTRGAKHVRADADDMTRVCCSAVEALLRHGPRV